MFLGEGGGGIFPGNFTHTILEENNIFQFFIFVFYRIIDLLTCSKIWERNPVLTLSGFSNSLKYQKVNITSRLQRRGDLEKLSFLGTERGVYMGWLWVASRVYSHPPPPISSTWSKNYDIQAILSFYWWSDIKCLAAYFIYSRIDMDIYLTGKRYLIIEYCIWYIH